MSQTTEEIPIGFLIINDLINAGAELILLGFLFLWLIYGEPMMAFWILSGAGLYWREYRKIT